MNKQRRQLPAASGVIYPRRYCLMTKKDYDKALDLLSKAQAVSPQDQSIRGITDEMRKKSIASQ